MGTKHWLLRTSITCWRYDYPYNIQRADAIRYLVVHYYGGVYADMDYECPQAFDPLINSMAGPLVNPTPYEVNG
ncbi:MAG: mannosyltransferase OCH1-like enzyme [Saprospiraceae bacterium]|jgi:mannosyltransferase OCH1-like enzyme